MTDNVLVHPKAALANQSLKTPAALSADELVGEVEVSTGKDYPVLVPHELADVSALLDDEHEDFQALVADIKQQGLLDAVVLFEGKILDGRHRYRATVQAKQVLKTAHFLGTKAEALSFVMSRRTRRNETEAQKVAAANAYLKHLKALRKAGEATQASDLPDNKPAKSGRPATNADVKQVADEMGVNARSLRDVEKIDQNAAPEVLDAINDGTLSLRRAKAIAALPQEAQAEAVERARKEATKLSADPQGRDAPSGAVRRARIQGRLISLTQELNRALAAPGAVHALLANPEARRQLVACTHVRELVKGLAAGTAEAASDAAEDTITTPPVGQDGSKDVSAAPSQSKKTDAPAGATDQSKKTEPAKRRPGGTKKSETQTKAAAKDDKPKRKPGRPKKSETQAKQ